MKKLYIKTETGGTNPNQCALLRLTAVAVAGGRTVGKFDKLIAPGPGKKVESEALEANGLSLEVIDREGVTFEAGFLLFSDFLSRHVDKFEPTDKFTHIGYASRFDEQVLREFFRDHKDRFFGSWFFNPSLELRQLAAFKLAEHRHLIEDFSLKGICTILDVLPEGWEESHYGGFEAIELDRRIESALLSLDPNSLSLPTTQITESHYDEHKYC